MPTDFHFVPLSPEPISGPALLAQTEQAINDLGAHADETRELAEEAKSEAAEAVTTADVALSTATDAVLTAQDALTGASNAQARADDAFAEAWAATAVANQANATANSAYDLAAIADGNATAAKSAADTALVAAEDAAAAATSAEDKAAAATAIAGSALDIAQGATGVFITKEETVDANDYFGLPEKVFAIAPGSVNFPNGFYDAGGLTSAAYLNVNLDDASTSCTQFAWLADGGAVYHRTGVIRTIVTGLDGEGEDITEQEVAFGPWASGGGSSAALPLFTVLWRAVDEVGIGELRLDVDNGQLSRAAYPDAAAKIDALLAAGSSSVAATDEAWLTERTANGLCGRFSPGDGSTYFRIPYWSNLVAPATGRSTDGIGDFVPDEMRPITGEASFQSNTGLVGSPPFSGVFKKGKQAYSYSLSNVSGYTSYALGLDSSLLGASYNGDTTHGPLIIQVPVLVMYHTIADPAALNAAEVVQAVAEKLDAAVYGTDASTRVKALARIAADGTIMAATNVTASTRSSTGAYSVALPAGLFSSATKMVVEGNVYRPDGGMATITISTITTTQITLILRDGGNAATNLAFGVIVYELN